MAVFYLDASAVLKRYRTEKGTEVVDDIYDGRGEQHIILTSQLTCIEVESVAARARKAGILNDEHDRGSQPLVFVGSDRELLDACEANGIKYVDPEAADAMEKLKMYRIAKQDEGDPLA